MSTFPASAAHISTVHPWSSFKVLAVQQPSDFNMEHPLLKRVHTFGHPRRIQESREAPSSINWRAISWDEEPENARFRRKISNLWLGSSSSLSAAFLGWTFHCTLRHQCDQTLVAGSLHQGCHTFVIFDVQHALLLDLQKLGAVGAHNAAALLPSGPARVVLSGTAQAHVNLPSCVGAAAHR